MIVKSGIRIKILMINFIKIILLLSNLTLILIILILKIIRIELITLLLLMRKLLKIDLLLIFKDKSRRLFPLQLLGSALLNVLNLGKIIFRLSNSLVQILGLVSVRHVCWIHLIKIFNQI